MSVFKNINTYFVCNLQNVPSEYEPAGQSSHTVSIYSVPIQTQLKTVNKISDRSHR